MNSFVIEKDGDLEYLQSNILNENKNIVHFFSGRKGGVSAEEFESLNLGVYTNDSKENVSENFKRICSSTKMHTNIAYLNQEHGKKVFIVNKDNISEVTGSKGDAIVTNEKNLPIGVFTADCVPILLYDKNNKVVAAIHAGWRGVEAKILSETFNVMKDNFASSSKDIICAIGPAIGPCCFEVSRDVADKFTFLKEKENSIFVDLFKEVYSEAKSLGFLEENIDISEKCTVCENELFHSYRREKGKTGRIGSFIEIV